MGTSNSALDEKRSVLWAVVAAMKREMAPLRRHSSSHLLLVETGMGQRNADRAVRQLFDQKSVRAVIHVGMAGALSPVLQVGDLVIGKEVQGTHSFEPSPALLAAAAQIKLDGVGAHTGTVITQDEILFRAADKQRLALQLATGTVACVDMESAAVAAACTQYKVPFLVVRSISDRLDEDLPLDLNRFRGRSGNLRIGKLVVEAALHPGWLPGLFELRRRSRRCAQHLALYVEQLMQIQIAGV
jgi:adenosylhomocysteine nucleosidase